VTDVTNSAASPTDTTALLAEAVNNDTALAQAAGLTVEELHLATTVSNTVPPEPVSAPVVPPVEATSSALAVTGGSIAESATVLRWSDKATWGGVLPTARADVVIPAGKVILLDMDPPALAGLRIEGTLRFDRRNTALRANYIDVTGALEIGTAAAPFAQKAVITLDGAPVATNDGVSRGLNVRGGRVELYGAAPSPTWTKLNEHAAAGATALTLKDSLYKWKVGDTVAVAPTDYYTASHTERMNLAGVTTNKVVLDKALSAFRWGKLQYVTSTGLALTPDASFVPPTATTPTALDERATVVNLTRPIVIEGADDSAWQTSAFGAHMMIMDLKSKVVVDGVEFRRSGQGGVTGRYPIHWHMLSYNATTGALIGDATGNVIRNSAIWNSANRCVVIHATNGVQVLNNICEDIKGHAFFLEDAVERRNVLDGNVSLMTRAPIASRMLLASEAAGAPSGFWLTNPDNTVTNNLAADAEGPAYALAYPRGSLGLSTAVQMLPDRMMHATFANNTAHSSRTAGVQLTTAPRLGDAKGTLTLATYAPTTDGKEQNSINGARFQLKRITSFKNGDGAYRNNATRPDYVEWMTADNYGTDFAGSVLDGTLTGSLVVGFSLNNATPYPNKWPYSERAAFATYHSQMGIRNNVAVNFPMVDGKASGVFDLSDYYLSSVEMGTARNTGNRIINSNPGYHVPPPNLDGQPLNNRNWTLAGAFYDPNGYWGPKGNYATIDSPFLTYEAKCVDVAPAGKNGKSCEGPFYGLNTYNVGNTGLFIDPISVQRLDNAGNVVGTWEVGDGAVAPRLPNMRHFAARPGGRYVLRFPGKPLPKKFLANVQNAYRPTDNFLFAVQFDGSVNAAAYVIPNAIYNREAPMTALPGSLIYKATTYMTAATSLAEVSASTGNKFWQDRSNNLVWIKIQGSTTYPGSTSLVPDSDMDLSRPSSVAIYAK
jgi:hypothetical protein